MYYVFKIAIIQFPGTNCEQESARAIQKSGMKPVYFRWNEDLRKLKSFDGFFIPGGFSYEDRVRAGAIAGRDPLMDVIKKQVEAGKPLIGVCNGAQILVESGLIPGLEGYHLGASLASNNNGYLNIGVNIKHSSEQNRSAFNNFVKDHYFRLPIASGEGRLVIPQKILKQLIINKQIIFRYCDNQGAIKDEFPINPNGAVYNIAGVCNPRGNVLALMPHPERVEDGQVIFESMRKYLGESKVQSSKSIKSLEYKNSAFALANYKKSKDSVEMLVKLIITDNEAETLQTSLNNLGFKNIKVNRFIHWEIGLKNKSEGLPQRKRGCKLIDDLIKSGELLNTNKETPSFVIHHKELESNKAINRLLVRDIEGFTDDKKLDILKNRLGMKGLISLKRSVLWEIECSGKSLEEILRKNILFNPHSQDGFIYL